MNKTPGSDMLPYSIILMVFAVIIISILSAEDPNVEELNSQEFQRAVEGGP